MWARQILSTLVIGSFFLFSTCSIRAEQSGTAKAEALFDAAMEADAAGDSQEHDRLLNAALKADPDFKLARWHLGHVFFRGYWRSPDTVQAIVEHDPRWKEYSDLLQQASDTVDDHVKLARWCRRNNLVNEEKQHWQHVLQAVPEHPEALKYLGKKPYQDGYYSSEEIAELKQKERQAVLAFKGYQQEFKQLINEASSGDDETRAAKLAQLAETDDAAAVEALFDVLVNTCEESNSAAETPLEPFQRQVCDAVVSALESIPYHPATLRLLDTAVFAPQGEVRAQAASALRYREPTDFMPLLMESMVAPVKSEYSVSVTPKGRVQVKEEAYVEGRREARRMTQDSTFVEEALVITYRGRDGYRIPHYSEYSNPALAFSSAVNQVARNQTNIQIENEVRKVHNARIIDVLKIVTDKDLGDDPKAWWDDWNQFNELYTPEELPETTYSVTNYQTPRIEYRAMPSCFLAGTPVWTQAGPVPIETIKAGDLVLSQDPVSGRLDYCQVIDTTIRPPTGMLTLSVNDEEITTTLGHRFWVSGDGWQMAKFLNAGSQLFAVQGSKKLASIEEAEEAEAHNLVVDGYHTYFVGESRLLVHDNSCPVPTTVVLPGVEEGASK